MATIIGIAGSLRAGSFNSMLLRAAAAAAPAGLTVEIATLQGIPLYDADEEKTSGVPAAVTALKERLAGAAGLLLATPEYNASIPGVLKNALDWLSRPPADIARVFGGKPVAIMGATPGRGGTILAQAALLPVFRALGAEVWPGPRVHVSQAAKAFDAEGKIVDPAVAELVGKLMTGFAKVVG